MELRTLSKPDLKAHRDEEYIMSVDVARSDNTNNNQCSISILKIKRGKTGKIKNIQLVNIINVSAVINFKLQAIEIMKIKELYNAKMCVLDVNGLGVGLMDTLMTEQFDPQTDESLGCWNTTNTDDEPEIDDATDCLYALRSQTNNTAIIVNFMEMINAGKLQLLEKREDAGYEIHDTDFIKKEVLPFTQTDMLLEEIANLKLKTISNGKFTVEQQTKRIDKDRYSALAYGLWYIANFEDDESGNADGYEAKDYLFIN